MTTFLTDHILWVLGLGLLAAGVGILTSLRQLWRIVRDRRRGERRSWLGATAGALFGALIAGGLLFLLGEGILAMGPSLIEQARLQGEPAPELRFENVADQSTASLAEYRGRVVLLNFWATWCSPCRAEMPYLDRLQETHGESGLVVLQISDEDLPTITAFLDEKPMSTTHGRAESSGWPVAGLPTSFVVDREGVLRRTIIGPRSFEQFEKIVKAYL